MKRCLLFLCVFGLLERALPAVLPLDMNRYDRQSEIQIEAGTDRLSVRWLGSQERYCEVVFSRQADGALVRSVGTMDRALDSAELILRDLDPVTLLSVGERDLAKRSGWVIFFDKVHTRPTQSALVNLSRSGMRVRSRGKQAIVEVHELAALGFSGHLRFIFSSRSSLVRIEAVLKTQDDARAIVYDSGLTSSDRNWKETVWMSSEDELVRVANTGETESRSAEVTSVRYRTVLAEGVKGSVAMFPPPHQFFYPLDFADNFGFVWHGAGYRGLVDGMSIGVRQPLDGDRRYVPWFNAPPETEQRLAVYWYLTAAKGREAVQEVARYTRDDHYEPLSGHQRFTSHYHVEHTLDYLNREKAGDVRRVPSELTSPGFVKAFRRVGADIVHLAEFHNGRTPRLSASDRVQQLRTLHRECARLSDDSFLLLPGEEPNVHLGGHWLSFFPRPVYWVLNRPEGTPFVQDVPGLGALYHVGSRADVLALMERESGLMWTAHARIKGSTGYPDRYRDEAFFQSDRFLGAAWKAMPADLSWRRLGKRVLGLMDDMSNWGNPKYVVGEVDVFRVEPDYELYGHMNMNYLRLDSLPRYEDGWASVLRALREGRFFVTTGEVLIQRFAVAGKESGETLELGSGAKVEVEFDLDWTFPLAFAELVSGDGVSIKRETIDLSDEAEFRSGRFVRQIDLAGKRWVRLEVWDSAANGAFTQPIWIR